MCTKCGDTSCGGKCTKSCIKIYRPTVWRDGQTGIPGADGEPGVGIVNIVDNGDGTMTIFLSDATSYIINLPAAVAGKFVTDINPVVGDDTQWELTYDDASTLIISAAYYIINAGTGVPLIFNQAGHPTEIRSLKPLNDNAKILTALSVTGDEIDFNVKQYGMQDNLSLDAAPGALSILDFMQPRYETFGGGVAFVQKSGGGTTISNSTLEEYKMALEFIDAYKSRLYFKIRATFDITYDDASYTNAVTRKFHMGIGVGLNAPGTPFPADFFTCIDYWHGNHETVMYDMYKTGTDTTSNKLRRFAESKVCDVLIENVAPDPGLGWFGTGNASDKLYFRYPFLENLTDPAGGGDVIQNYEFEAIGSITVHHDGTTDFLSTIPQIKNH